jgi:hypothetical protein
VDFNGQSLLVGLNRIYGLMGSNSGYSLATLRHADSLSQSFRKDRETRIFIGWLVKNLDIRVG